MIHVDLSCTDVVGVIIPMQTGVTWSNQCGGTMCAHPQLEGIFVPLNPGLQPGDKNPAYEQWRATDPPEFSFPEDEARDMFRRAIEHAGLDRMFEVAPVIPDECGEAWIPVRIKETHWSSPLQPFAGQSAIFTYVNSD